MTEPRHKLRAIDLTDRETLKRELEKIDRHIERVVLDNPTATHTALHKLSITAIRNNGLEAGDAYIRAAVRKLKPCNARGPSRVGPAA
jgi:hypothetical protein